MLRCQMQGGSFFVLHCLSFCMQVVCVMFFSAQVPVQRSASVAPPGAACNANGKALGHS